MDMNELFRRHQLALIALFNSKSHIARTSAAREADYCAVQIGSLRSDNPRHRTVLSSRTFLKLSGNWHDKEATAKCVDC